MSREHVARVALLAFPANVRGSHGPEIVDTLLDLSARSRRAFARESVTLVLAGLRSRARVTAAAGTGRVIADGCCGAAVLWSLLMLVYVLPILTAHQPALSRAEWIVPFALPAALALVGFDRAAGLCGLVWLATFEGLTVSHGISGMGTRLNLEIGAIHAIPFAVMAAAPRTRRRDPRRLLWLVGAVALGLLAPPFGAAFAVMVLAVSAIGLVRLPTDLRPAIAAAIVWTSIGLGALLAVPGFTPVALTTAAGPLIVAAAALRLRSAQRRAFG